MAIAIDRLSDVSALGALAQDAEADGHRMVAQLIDDWTSGANRFSAAGECLYVARLNERVAGVCGLNVDPYLADASVGRVRRLYVATDLRRLHIGSVLVGRIVDDARATFARLRLRTRNPVAAAFYESLGFIAVADDEVCTHELELANG